MPKDVEELARWGVRVAVTSVGGDRPGTEDARFEHERALERGGQGAETGREGVIVDAIYGIGFRPRPDGGALARTIAPIAEAERPIEWPYTGR